MKHTCDPRIAQICPANTVPPRPDIVLSTGLIVAHRAMCNGATAALTVPSGMSDEEWMEYCDKLKSQPR